VWFRRLFAHLNHRFSLRESSDPFSAQYWRGRLECLDAKLFKLDLVRACVTELTVELDSIDGYLALFRYLDALDFAVDRIDLKSFRLNHRAVTVERFFQDNHGRYLNALETIQGFKQGALRLLTRLEALPPEQTGIIGYNARILKALLYSTAVIADHLRNYSLKRP
jgi:hypothetical protein